MIQSALLSCKSFTQHSHEVDIIPDIKGKMCYFIWQLLSYTGKCTMPTNFLKVYKYKFPYIHLCVYDLSTIV